MSTSTAMGVVASSVALSWAAGSPSTICQALRTDRDFDHLLPHAAGLVAWLCLGWFCTAVGLELLSQLPGVVGAHCSALAASVSPRLVRRFAQAAVGLTILAGPMASPSAWAASGSMGDSTAVTAPADVSVDRPLGSGPAPVAAPSAHAPELPLDWPAGSFVASQPAAPPLVTPTAPAAIVAGTPHREEPREGYVVRGDALWTIAARHLGAAASAADISREWPRWYAANRSVIGPNPNVLQPGELLVAPNPSAS